MSEAGAIARSPEPRTRRSLAADLSAFGLRPADTVIVHASLSALGWVAGGPVAVIEALLDVLGPTGTLVMPAHSGQLSDPAQWRAPPVPPAWIDTIRRQMPPFDPRTTPTRGMGAVAELFRCWPGTRRSGHPTCSFAARGPRAADIVGRHELASPLGDGSPLAALYAADARVLLLGVGFDRCTMLHLAEQRAWPGRPRERQGSPMLEDGVSRWVEYDSEPDIDPAHFVPVGRQLLAAGEAVAGRVGSADSVLVGARAAVDHAVAIWRSMPPPA